MKARIMGRRMLMDEKSLQLNGTDKQKKGELIHLLKGRKRQKLLLQLQVRVDSFQFMNVLYRIQREVMLTYKSN